MAKKEWMTSRERVDAALRLQIPDRVPLYIFGPQLKCKLAGFNLDEYCHNPELIAQANLHYTEKYGDDISDHFPDTWFLHEGWGMPLRWMPGVPPVPVQYLIQQPEDYEKKLKVLDPYRDGRMPVVLESIRLVHQKTQGKISILTLAFAPLSYLAQIRGMVTSMQDLILHPKQVHAALEVLTETVIRFYQAAAEAGASLFVYHNAREDYSLLTAKQVDEFGLPYDTRVLTAVKALGVPTVLHMCGPEPMMGKLIADLPAGSFAGIQFWDKGANVTLADAKRKYGDKICLMAGFDNVGTVPFGTSEEVKREAENSLQVASGGGGFILGGGCELPPLTPEANLHALSETVKSKGMYDH